jgi:hypothetical protein
VSTTLGEYGGGGAITGSALHLLVPLSHIYDEMVVDSEASKEVGKEEKRVGKFASQPVSFPSNIVLRVVFHSQRDQRRPT